MTYLLMVMKKLKRGIKNSNNEHISIKEFRKLTKKLDNRMEKQIILRL